MTLTRTSFLISAALAAAMVLGGCATTDAPTTLTDTAGRTPQLSTLSRLINQAGLADTLRGAGPYTVFAPTDDAFKALPAKTLEELSSNKELLRSVLTYHVVAGKAMSADAKNGNLVTLQGTNVAIYKSGSFLTVEDAVVTQTDVQASNGAIHIIDKVLLPLRR